MREGRGHVVAPLAAAPSLSSAISSSSLPSLNESRVSETQSARSVKSSRRSSAEKDDATEPLSEETTLASLWDTRTRQFAEQNTQVNFDSPFLAQLALEDLFFDGT